MATYRYIARTGAGEEVTGVMQAENQAAVVRSLDEKSLFPVRVAEEKLRQGLSLGGGRVRMRDVGTLYSQMADLLRAGVPVLRALEVLARALPPGALKREVLRVREQVAEGRPLADALGERPDAFAPAHVAMVRAGERGGFLEEVLANLAAFVERQDELRAKVRGSMIYPLLLLTVLSAVLIAALVWLVPQFAEFLEEAEKPWPTKVLFGISALVRGHWMAALVVAAGAIGGGWAAFRSEAGRRAWEHARLKLPLFGRAIRMVSITRFCRVLGTMLASGVPILEALRISKDATGSDVLAESIEGATENVRAGEPLAAPLASSGLFPAEVIEMIAVAEESNQLEAVLVRIADVVEQRTNRQVDLAVRLIEPLILVVMAAAIGFLALALLYPILLMATSLSR